jgi:hypothetical protein
VLEFPIGKNSQALSETDIEKIRDHAAGLNYKPLISIIMPTFESSPEFLSPDYSPTKRIG